MYNCQQKLSSSWSTSFFKYMEWLVISFAALQSDSALGFSFTHELSSVSSLTLTGISGIIIFKWTFMSIILNFVNKFKDIVFVSWASLVILCLRTWANYINLLININDKSFRHHWMDHWELEKWLLQHPQLDLIHPRQKRICEKLCWINDNILGRIQCYSNNIGSNLVHHHRGYHWDLELWLHLLPQSELVHTRRR